MSYDLVFWRQEEGFAGDPAAVMHRLLEEQIVDGLVELRVASFLDAVVAAFPGAARVPNGEREFFLELPSDRVVEISWSDQHVHACCRGTDNDDMNALIDVALDHDCRLYDPQTNERFG